MKTVGECAREHVHVQMNSKCQVESDNHLCHAIVWDSRHNSHLGRFSLHIWWQSDHICNKLTYTVTQDLLETKEKEVDFMDSLHLVTCAVLVFFSPFSSCCHRSLCPAVKCLAEPSHTSQQDLVSCLLVKFVVNVGVCWCCFCFIATTPGW